MNNFFLTGQPCELGKRAIIYDNEFDCYLHVDIVEPLKTLQKHALKAGQQLQVASAFRDFDRQLSIWNDKVSGRRQILNRQGKLLNKNNLSEWETVQAILHWSALPGSSRHHWGTDLDVFNPQCLPENYKLQLTREEYEGGVLNSFNQWLGKVLSEPDCEFYRPYCGDPRLPIEDGVAQEPWHISYRPLAEKFGQGLTIDTLAEALEKTDILLKTCILDHIDEIFKRYIKTN